ncbi:hypothetical protein CLV75_2058 [Ruegeria conchae]|uniref:Uncharacterized protein n=1 Tax=Ruegeria conchae TaxID=981384 RepID=A0A497ZRG3_9RHOB|nr:hypothetical protein CLV75_2058 [Ruegeria conchae]
MPKLQQQSFLSPVPALSFADKTARDWQEEPAITRWGAANMALSGKGLRQWSELRAHALGHNGWQFWS